MISILHYCKKTGKNLLIIDLVFHQNFAIQNTKQLISVDSPSLAEQNSTSHFVVACTIVKIFLIAFRPLKAEFFVTFMIE